MAPDAAPAIAPPRPVEMPAHARAAKPYSSKSRCEDSRELILNTGNVSLVRIIGILNKLKRTTKWSFLFDSSLIFANYSGSGSYAAFSSESLGGVPIRLSPSTSSLLLSFWPSCSSSINAFSRKSSIRWTLGADSLQAMTPKSKLSR